MRLNLPPCTRTLLIVLVSLTLLNDLLLPNAALAFFTRIGHGSPFLSLVPGRSYRYPWTLLTATLVEQNIYGLLVTGLTVVFGGRYLERAWGTAEFAKFIVLVSVVPNTVCFVLYLIMYGATHTQASIGTTISGGIAIQSAFLVAFKQLVPEHTVSLLKGLLRIRVKHFPAVFLAANTVAGLILGTETAMFLSWFSFLTSWAYLRFYRVSPLMMSSTTNDAETVRGDASDTFAFAYFFPEPIHGPIAKVSDQLYELLVSIRICIPFSAEDIEVSNEQAMARAEGGLPTNSRGMAGGRREDAERRRAVALKALDQRLHAASARGFASDPVPPASSPSVITVPTPVVKPDADADDKSDAGSSH